MGDRDGAYVAAPEFRFRRSATHSMTEQFLACYARRIRLSVKGFDSGKSDEENSDEARVPFQKQ